jgi:two-component system sensor histidine kinase UhpB
MPADKILIVEDESEVAQTLERYLKRLGYGVAGVVDNGADALNMVATARPDLALMDIEIQGGMDGIDLAERFRKQHDIPVIFLTGRSDDETLERVRRSESFGYLLKPFRLVDLKAGIELALIRYGHEAHLKQVEQSFSAAITSTGDAILIVDQMGAVSFLNPAAERLTGWPAGKAVGQRLDAVFKIDGNDGAAGQSFRSGSEDTFVHEATLHTAAGRDVPIEVNSSTVRDEVRGTLGSVLVFRDITERKRFEAHLKKSQDELRKLAGHLESAREAERTRIAREIHDEFGQLLTGFKFDLSWLEKKLSAKPEAKRAVLVGKVRAMTELLHSMVQSVRRIAAELRPGVLDDLGLAAAVEWQAADLQKRTGIKAHVRAALSERELPREIATALFRIFQESLTNVARHAEAKNVRVSLREQSGRISLEVSDDGRGITEADMNKADAFGLLGMRERIAPLRGQCEIHGVPGQGTTVSVSVPLDISDRPERGT